MTTLITQIQRGEAAWTSYKDPIVVGKDMLELLGISMYLDPLTIYREYIQNAADAIDEARRQNILPQSLLGRVDINFDVESRTVRIRDNGIGIRRDDFATRLTAFGASPKRGLHARGFRGVGRLSGVGFCQALTFRSRGPGEKTVHELRWDCRKMKANLRSPGLNGDLRNLVNEIVETRELDSRGFPAHFFEVELHGIVRHRNDSLLNPIAVYDYLSQVAPVPFSPEFRFGAEIVSSLEPQVALGNLDIRIGGLESPVYRPHRNRFEVSREVFDEFAEIEFISIPAIDSGSAALGWVLHHSYKGALPPSANLKGLRFRSGNMQVGDDRILDSLFPEQRFNSWSVGEIHVTDERIVSNGRRDQYDQNPHYDNLINYLSPVARRLSARCRTSSIKRNMAREFERRKLLIQQTMAVLRQGVLPPADRKNMEANIDEGLKTMEKIARRDLLTKEAKLKLRKVLLRTQRQFEKVKGKDKRAMSLSRMPQSQRRVYENMFGLIYECSSNPEAAKTLVDRILRRLH